MKTQRRFPAFTVTEKAEISLRSGHPWVYAEEFVRKPENCENGALADVFSQKGAYLGTGFFSEKSKIGIRVLSSNANETFGEEFWRRRVKYALEYRLTVMGKTDFRCCRLIFGESDGMPGLTVDRFENILVSQVLSYGMDRIKGQIYSILCQTLLEMGYPVGGVYERNDVAIRELEGLAQYKGWYESIPHPAETHTRIVENGIVYNVDFENGQKTGFFLDQKYNRLALSKLCEGKRVLDCFTHTGSFALNAVKGGAEHVTAVDVSETALECARANAELNGMTNKMDFVCADVFDYLPSLAETKRKDYDLIILDPPAFTKSRRTVISAGHGYREINFRAMKLLPRGGYLATASCSHFMEEKLFIKAVASAAEEAGVALKQIESRAQSPDHPVLWNVPETNYLKFFMFQVI
ncbi:MAG: class I SAM-dependent rRNA methyltransferase [Clostridia bacterium]|nr:class I SAM-dependent rRNA methyltransferase [Clostridia bacterium]